MAAGLLGELPALPLHTAGKYVAAAYVVLFALVLIYVVIMAIRLGRIERELGELLSESEMGEDPEQAADEEDLDVSRAGSTVA
jgi:flagellar biosynthesis/type III secretory pathway M-ring protein FliF/YscJ